VSSIVERSLLPLMGVVLRVAHPSVTDHGPQGGDEPVYRLRVSSRRSDRGVKHRWQLSSKKVVFLTVPTEPSAKTCMITDE
jgi:hypothetical protein